MTTTRAVTAVGSLADPIRRSLYEYIAGRHAPVTRDEAADAVQISPSKAKFHLDRLEKEGLLEVELRRLSGRTGPGAGRPSKLYRRSAEELRVSLPERRYDVVGAVLAAAVEQAAAGGDLTAQIGASAYARGAADAAATGRPGTHDEAPAGPSEETTAEAPALEESLAAAEQVLAHLGYEPEVQGRELVLHNCPFDALADEHRSLVCSMNQRYVQGVLDSVGAERLQSCLAPSPGYCCVVARPTPPDHEHEDGHDDAR